MRWLALLALLFATPAWSQALVVPTCGGLNLTAGTPHNVTVDINGQSCRVGGGGGAVVVSSTWSLSDATANGMVLSNGGLTVTTTTGSWGSVRGSVGKNSGKLYAEFLINGGTTSVGGFGLADTSYSPTSYLSSNPNSFGVFNNSTSGGAGTTYTINYNFGNIFPQLNDVWAIAVDFAAGKFWLAQNNIWFGSGNPTTGANPMVSITGSAQSLSYFPTLSFNTTNAVTTLQPTAASQKYAPPAGFSAWDGAGATGCSQATAYLARATGEVTHAADLTTLICGLVTDGVWAKLDALYVLAQQNATDSLLNLVGTSYTLSNGSALPFTAYQGYTGNGGYLDTGFNPTTAPSPHLTQNNGSAGVWMYSNPNDGNIAIGTGSNVGDVQITPNFNGSFYGFVFVATGGNNVVKTAVNSLYVADRSASNRTDLYVSGAVAFNDNPNPSQAPNSATMHILSISLGAASAAFFGASLGSAGQTALYNRLRTYLTSVGVP